MGAKNLRLAILMATLAAVLACADNVAAAVDEVHWTITGQTSVTFDWRGPDSTINYGLTSAYGSRATAVRPSPLPFSSAGPFWEARLTGLTENTVYHYSIAGSADHGRIGT